MHLITHSLRVLSRCDLSFQGQALLGTKPYGFTLGWKSRSSDRSNLYFLKISSMMRISWCERRTVHRLTETPKEERVKDEEDGRTLSCSD
jgi:hypothetical protein